MNAIAQPVSVTPWYRERWPWFLMLGPAIVVVAGTLTAVFAFETFDGLVADDYYKQGKAINLTLSRDALARQRGYAAELGFGHDRGLALTFAQASPTAAELKLLFAHPTRGGLDRSVVLRRNAEGRYVAALPDLPAAHWYLMLEDETASWRLTGQWQNGNGGEAAVALTPAR